MGKFEKFNIAKWQKKYLLNEGKLNEVDDDTLVKYKDEDGNDHEIKYGSAIKYDDNHPAKKAAVALQDKDGGGSDQEAGQEKEPQGKLSGADFERDGGDDSKKDSSSDSESKIASAVADYIELSDRAKIDRSLMGDVAKSISSVLDDLESAVAADGNHDDLKKAIDDLENTSYVQSSDEFDSSGGAERLEKIKSDIEYDSFEAPSGTSDEDFTKKNNLSIKLDARTDKKYKKAFSDIDKEWKAADGDRDLQKKISKKHDRISAKRNQEKRDNLFKAFGDDLEGFEDQDSLWLKNLSKHYGGSVAKKLKPIIKDKIAQEKASRKDDKSSLDDLVKDIDTDSNMAEMEKQLMAIARKKGLNPSDDEIEAAVEKRANQAGGFFESKTDFVSMMERFSKKK